MNFFKEKSEPIATKTIENKEKEPTFEVPIIDVVRHGETEYKELSDPNFKLDVNVPDFALDSEHLDLTENGIKNIHETAEQLASVIDKKNEVIIFIVSPQFRALSSALIFEKVFNEHGIIMLNSNSEENIGKPREIKTSRSGLGQIPMQETLEKEGFGKIWLEAHKKFGENHPEDKNKPPAELHSLVAATLGKQLSEIFSKSHKDMAAGFKRFLRHATIIEKYFQPETKKKLAGKKLRIITITHEERMMDFAQQSLGLDKTVAKGQMLEIRPKDSLGKYGKEIGASVRLYGKNGEPNLTSDIKLKFSPEELLITKL